MGALFWWMLAGIVFFVLAIAFMPKREKVPDSVAGWIAKAEPLLKDDREAALSMLERAVAISPDDPETHLRVASFLLQHSHHGHELLDRAMHYLDWSVDLDDGNDRAFLIRGNVLAASGRPADAIDCYTQAIRINPQNALAFNMRGRALRSLERGLEAFDDLARAVVLAQNPAYALYRISFEADLREATEDPLRATNAVPARTGAMACQRCSKRFESLEDPAAEADTVEVMACNVCGTVYCWPACTRMEPCACGSQKGFHARHVRAA